MTELIVFLLVSVLILAIALLLAGRKGGVRMFVSADGKLPWAACGLSLFISFFSAGTFVAWGSVAYRDGLVAITIQETMCLAGLVVAWLIAPRWRSLDVTTVAAYLSDRFGLRVQRAYTLLFFFVSFFSAAAFLYPVARILSFSWGVDARLGVVLLGILCMLYVSTGGLWSVVLTDVIQFVILTAVVLIAAPLSLREVGGVEALLSQAPQGFLSPVSGNFPWLFIIAFFLYNLVYLGGGWSFVQRYGAVRRPADASKASLLFALLYAVSPILWMLPALTCRLSNGGLADAEAENAFLLMCRQVLPRGVLGIMVAGLVFASLSSINSLLNAMASVFSQDIVARMRPGATDRALLRTARISSLVFGLLVIGIALLIPRMGGLVNYIIGLAALTGAPLYLPVLWSLFSRRQTGNTLLVTTFFSLSLLLLLKFAILPRVCPDGARTWEMMAGVGIPFLLLAIFEVKKCLFANNQSITL